MKKSMEMSMEVQPKAVRQTAPPAQGLYDPRFEHDACGVGFVVNVKGQRSQEIIRQALELLESQGRGAERTLCPVADYQNPNVSEKVVRIIMSYTGYVNRTVWHR